MTEKEIKTPELPKGWTYTSLREVLIRLSNGITQKQGTTGIPVTRIETISKGTIDLERVGYLDGLSPETILKYKLIYGDMLFSHINSDAHLGKTAIFHMADTQLLHGMNLLLIRANQDTINSNYLNFLMNYYRFLGVFFTIAQHAVNQSSINQAKLNALSIPLPPVPEQHRIVAKIEELFTRLDAGVETLKKIHLQLKRYRQSVLKSAFNGELTAEWRKAHKDELEPASVLLERIKSERKKSVKHKELPTLDTSDLPGLPEGWVWARMIDLTESMKNGIYKPPQFYGTHGVACLRMYNIENGCIVWKDVKRMTLTPDEVIEYGLKEGDILVNRVNSRELVGKAAPIPSGLETCVYESKNIRLRLCKKHMVSKFISYWLQLSGQNYFNRNAQQTVGMASINQEQLGSMPIPLCSLSEQKKSIEEVDRAFSVADEIEITIEQSLKQSDRLRQSILKKAFEGKLVPQNPDDEPAEKLLERIRLEKTRMVQLRHQSSRIVR